MNEVIKLVVSYIDSLYHSQKNCEGCVKITKEPESDT